MEIEVVSRGLYVLRSFGSIAAAVPLAILLRIDGLYLIIATIGATAYLGYRLTRGLDRGLISITLADEGLKIEWLKQFFWHSRPNKSIKWSEISDYTLIPDQHFDVFRIRLKTKTSVRYSLAKTDLAFLEFLQTFESKIGSLKLGNPEITAKEGKTFYETTWARVLAVLALLFMVGVVIMLIVRPPKKMNYGSLFMGLGATVFFVSVVFSRWRKRKS